MLLAEFIEEKLHEMTELWCILWSPRPQGTEGIVAAVLEEWECITQDEILELIDSMPMRVQAVIMANGGHTQY